ncbi:hypothetical protein [Comamonas sp. BIGb0124]|uniref:hypothetical protein n=1 Tax=Comamonas sp. BIGb0124 TaxID=2485130 RepID=UPI000F4627E1|nr:hypothetical protein [Comamonas sp. BIGb0124]
MKPERAPGSPFEIHACPVCGLRHAVHPVLHALAYGRQLTCSPGCKLAWRHALLRGTTTLSPPSVPRRIRHD